MHNITSVFLLCKLFLLLFISFPFLVLGYLGHLQPVGHLPVGMKRTASTQPAHAHSQKCLCGVHATLWVRLIQKFQKHAIRYYNNHRNVVDSLHYCMAEHRKLLHCEKHISSIKKKKLGRQKSQGLLFLPRLDFRRNRQRFGKSIPADQPVSLLISFSLCITGKWRQEGTEGKAQRTSQRRNK